MNVFSQLRENIKVICESVLAADACPQGWFDPVTVEPPRDASHGDMSTNAAMVLCKRAGINPRQLAEQLVSKIEALEEVREASIAGPGFINMSFAPEFWQKQLAVMLSSGLAYGDSAIGETAKINVEYVSANPTGPLHIGHARGAVVGDALANLLSKAGFAVTKEYYVNDAGGQIDTLARSAFLRYREALGEVIGEIPEGLYPGDYLIPVGEALKAEYGDGLAQADESEWLPKIRLFAVGKMLELIRTDLADMGIEHEVFTSEKSLHDAGRVAEVLAKLETKGLVYKGVLEPPKGKLPDDWEPREQTLFKTTDFGDDTDRALKKNDGSWTYFAADVAYAEDKLNRGFAKQVLILGADHGGYVKRMQAAVSALSDGLADIRLQLCQLVKFMEDGQPIKMSKRAGTFTTVRDVLEAVGKDVLRFIMLTRKPEQPLDFDLTKVTEQSKDNPVFYVQYAHARCKSLIRMAEEQLPEAVEPSCSPTDAQVALLASEEELAMLKKLAEWPRVVEAAAIHYEPHRVAYYLQELAAAFHSFWNLGNDNISLRFIQKDAIDGSIARLALARAVATVIASGLTVLGVEPVEEMR